MKIMVIEPHVNVIRTICAALRIAFGKGLELVEVANYSEATVAVKDHLDTDIVLVTYSFPRGHGGRVAQDIKRMNPSLKVVIMSTIGGGTETALELGLDGFIFKDHLVTPELAHEFVAKFMAQKG